MFQRILVPLDGSSVAEQALSVVACLARASHGSIVLVHAVNAAMTRTVREANLAQGQAYLDQISTASTLHDLSVETVVRAGSAASVILATMHSHAIDLIVISNHANKAAAHRVMGPTAQEVTHLASVPVLLLRADRPLLTESHVDDHRPLRILVGLDGSAYAKQALLPAARLMAALAAPTQGIVHLTRVVTLLPYQRAGQYCQRPEDAMQKAKQSLAKTVENIRDGFEAPSIADLGLQLTWSVALGSDIAETLVRIAEYGEGIKGAEESTCCDIIALSTHGQSSLPRWTMGRVAEQVLTETRLPVLIVSSQRSLK